MAIMNFRIGHRTERSGDGARQDLAYLTRTGEYAPAEMAYLERTSEDTVERGDFVDKTHGNLPAWAQDNPGKFFAAAEAQERTGSQRQGRWATTWQIALPKELTREEQWNMGTAFVHTHLAQHAYFCVMHDPVKDGQHQPHLHVMFSERTDDGQAHPEAVYFRRPEVGGCAKDRWFSQQSSVEELRTAWADWTNYTLERAGHAERVHPRSLYARDIERKPEPKIGYSADQERRAEQRQIRAQRNRALEQAKASEGWEARKQRLDMPDIHALPRDEFLQATYARAHSRQPGTWERGTAFVPKVERMAVWRTKESAHLEREIHALEQYLDRVQAECQVERFFQEHGRTRSAAGQRQAERVLAEGREHGVETPQEQQTEERPLREVIAALAASEERIHRGRLRVKLWEEEGHGGYGR
jgi:hypothetical protein